MEEVEVKQTKVPISANASGVLMGSNIDEQYRLAKAYHSSRLMPAALDSPEKVLVALQMCHELGLPPMTSIGNICVIKQTPMIFGNLPLSLVMKSGLLLEIKEEINDTKASCTVRRKGFGDSVTREFSIEDAKKAGLLDKGPWKQYPKRMMQCRARAWALKDVFPDVLGGISIVEYDAEIEVSEINKDSVSDGSQARALNQLFGADYDGTQRSIETECGSGSDDKRASDQSGGIKGEGERFRGVHAEPQGPSGAVDKSERSDGPTTNTFQQREAGVVLGDSQGATGDEQKTKQIGKSDSV